MDIFMDKLANKLTAQEIIRANNTAETEELTRLRNQVDEFDKCLAKLQQLLEEGAGKRSQLDAEQDDQLQMLTERFESVGKAMDECLEDMDAVLDERLGDMQTALEQRFTGLDLSLDEKFNHLDSRLGEKTDDQLTDKLVPITDTVHKECVKVYRNVQAVVQEESGKQAETLDSAAKGVQRVGKKLNTVFGISLVALLLSLLSTAIQIMNMLNIKLF